MNAYARRYGRAASDTYHLVRALTYFEDAERDDPRLLGLAARRWSAIKQYFITAAARVLA